MGLYDLGLDNLPVENNLAAAEAIQETVQPSTESVNIDDIAGVVQSGQSFGGSVLQGSLEAGGITQIGDAIENNFLTEDEKKIRNMKKMADERSTNAVGYALGQMSTLALPMAQGMSYGRGLAAMGAQTGAKAARISSSVAKRQAAKGNKFGYKNVSNQRFNSGLGNAAVEEVAGTILSIGYDYKMDKANQAVYGEESRFDLGDSALWSAALSAPLTAGIAGATVGKNYIKTSRKQVQKLKDETAKTGGFTKAMSGFGEEMKNTGRLKENGDQWTYMAEDGLGMHGTKIGDDYYIDVERSTFDNETISSKFSTKMTDEDVSTFNNYRKAAKGEGKEFGIIEDSGLMKRYRDSVDRINKQFEPNSKEHKAAMNDINDWYQREKGALLSPDVDTATGEVKYSDTEFTQPSETSRRERPIEKPPEVIPGKDYKAPKPKKKDTLKSPLQGFKRETHRNKQVIKDTYESNAADDLFNRMKKKDQDEYIKSIDTAANKIISRKSKEASAKEIESKAREIAAKASIARKGEKLKYKIDKETGKQIIPDQRQLTEYFKKRITDAIETKAAKNKPKGIDEESISSNRAKDEKGQAIADSEDMEALQDALNDNISPDDATTTQKGFHESKEGSIAVAKSKESFTESLADLTKSKAKNKENLYNTVDGKSTGALSNEDFAKVVNDSDLKVFGDKEKKVKETITDVYNDINIQSGNRYRGSKDYSEFFNDAVESISGDKSPDKITDTEIYSWYGKRVAEAKKAPEDRGIDGYNSNKGDESTEFTDDLSGDLEQVTGKADDPKFDKDIAVDQRDIDIAKSNKGFNNKNVDSLLYDLKKGDMDFDEFLTKTVTAKPKIKSTKDKFGNIVKVEEPKYNEHSSQGLTAKSGKEKVADLDKKNFTEEPMRTQINKDLADMDGKVKEISKDDFEAFYKDPNNTTDSGIIQTRATVLDALESRKVKNKEAIIKFLKKEGLENVEAAEKEILDSMTFDGSTKGMSAGQIKVATAKAKEIVGAKKKLSKDISDAVSAKTDGTASSSEIYGINKAVDNYINSLRDIHGYTGTYSKDLYDMAFDSLNRRLKDQFRGNNKRGFSKYSLTTQKSYNAKTGKYDNPQFKDAKTIENMVNEKIKHVYKEGTGFSKDLKDAVDPELIAKNKAIFDDELRAATKQKAVRDSLKDENIATVDTADQHWYKDGEYTTLNVEGTNPKSALEIDMNSANQMVWGSDIKSKGMLVDGQIFMKDGSKGVSPENIEIVTHELTHDGIRRLGYTPDQLKIGLDELGVKYKDGDNLEELLTQRITTDLADELITQNSKVLGIKGYKSKNTAKVEYGPEVQAIRDNVMGLYNNPASGVNKWLSGYEPFKAPPMPESMTVNLARNLKRKATSFELVDELYSNGRFNPWLSLDDNSARMQYVAGMGKSMMNTQSESLVQDKKFMKEEMSKISATADKDMGEGVFRGAGVLSKRFFDKSNKFDAKGFDERIAKADDLFDAEIENVTEQIAAALGIPRSKIKFGAETAYDPKTQVYTIKSTGKEYFPAKGKKAPKVDESKGYNNTLGLDSKNIIKENYGHVKGAKVKSAVNSYQAVQKFSNALVGSNPELTHVLTDPMVKNIARTLDETLAAGRMKNAVDNGYDTKGIKDILSDSNGKHLMDAYHDGVEANRGYKQPQFGFNPMNSNFKNGYRLTAVPVGKAHKYKKTGDTMADGKLEVVYAPADEVTLGKQSGVLDNEFNQERASGHIGFKMDRGSNPGTILVDGMEYKIGKDSKPIGKTGGKYDFKLRDQSAFKIEDGIDYDFSGMYSQNTFGATQKRMEDMAATRIMNFLVQQGDGVTGAQLAGMNPKEAKHYIPFMTNPVTGDLIHIHNKNKDILMGTDGIKVTGEFATSLTKVVRGLIQGAKNAIIVGRPASYINSYTANTVSLMIHGDYVNPARAIKDVEKAKNQVKDFVRQRESIMKDFADPKRIKIGAKRLTRLQKDPLFYAMNDGGLQSSIRGDLSQLGLMPRNDLISLMKNNGVANMSEDAAKMVETAFLQPNTGAGDKLGEVFDYTEIAPKIALNNKLLADGKTPQEAATYVKMAFPDYNMNLPQVMALADEVVPFMKFFMNVPRMTAFTMAQKPGKLLGLYFASAGAVAGSNAWYGETNEYFSENGYIELAPGVYKYAESFNNYNMSMPGVADTSFLGGLFWPQNINPFTIESSELMWNRE